MKLIQISNFKAGSKIQGFFLCKEKHLRHTRTRDPYLDLLLQDQTGTITARVWDHVDDLKDRFEAGDPLAVKGVPTEYNGVLQLNVHQVNVATHGRYARYGYKPELLVPTIDEDPESLFKSLIKISNQIPNTHLKRLTVAVLKKYHDGIIELPGSINHHHPIRGGYVKHVLTTARLALQVAKLYPQLDISLLLAGTILHDIGKLEAYTGDLQTDYTEEGRLSGHAVIGRDILLREMANYKQFPEELQQKLTHIVLSHQTISLYGKAPHPRFPEALAVNLIDTIDSRVDLMSRIIDNDQDTDDWTDKRHFFNIQLWKK